MHAPSLLARLCKTGRAAHFKMNRAGCELRWCLPQLRKARRSSKTADQLHTGRRCRPGELRMHRPGPPAASMTLLDQRTLRPAFCVACQSRSIAANAPADLCASGWSPLDYSEYEQTTPMSSHTSYSDCRGAKCTPKSPAACHAAGVHTPQCGIDDGAHSTSDSSTPPRRATRARAHTHKRTHTVRTHLRSHAHTDA